MSTVFKWGMVWLTLATAFVWFHIFQIDNQGRLVFWPGVEDSLFIQTAQGQKILVNGGGDRKILQKLSQAMPWGDKYLDLVVLTSSTANHLTGLIEVLKNYKVDKVLWSGVESPTPLFQEWEDLLEEKKALVVIARSGEKIEFGSYTLEVLSPLNDLNSYQPSDIEKGNLVWRLKREEESFLFLGNVSWLELSSLAPEDLVSDIVEINGIQESLPRLFWSKIDPSLVIVSGSFRETNSLPGVILRQTEREGKIVINF